MTRCEGCDLPIGWDAIKAGALHDVPGCACDACCAHCWGDDSDCDSADTVDWRARALAAEAEVERLRGAFSWIPVAERVPDRGVATLVYVGRMTVATRIGFRWIEIESDRDDEPSHWMPLPAPPEAPDE